MPKNQMDDMVRIKIVKKNTLTRKAEVAKAPSKVIPPPPVVTPKKVISKKGPGWKLWFVASISIIFLFFALSYLFSRANVEITPRMEDKALNENLSAVKDGGGKDPSFDLVVISGEEEASIEVESEKILEVKAQGVVILYNKFSTAPQALLIDTQLEGSNGKIYKTDKRVLVPGIDKDGNPGKVEVGIYGANPGEEYNSAPLDFKILNFKNNPKYTKIYGRSKNDITGGVKGSFYVIEQVDRDKAASSLKDALQAKLLKKATEQIPEGFILFKDAVFLNVTDTSSNSYSKDKMVPINFKGTLYGFLLDEKKLTEKIAKDVVEKYDGSDVYISNLKDMTFTLANKENILFSEVKTINFSLKGKALIVWRFDTEKFNGELLGKKKKDFNSILSKYPNVTLANLTLKPFWRMSFPDKAEDIKVIVNYPK